MMRRSSTFGLCAVIAVGCASAERVHPVPVDAGLPSEGTVDGLADAAGARIDAADASALADCHAGEPAEAAAEAAESILVDLSPGAATNHISPLRAIGAAVDGQPAGATAQIYTPSNVAQMLASGSGSVSYRLYTELSVQHWHWNPTGTFSAGASGYWEGSSVPGAPIDVSAGFVLPHRGFTHDQGLDDGYSRLDDGDVTTTWKSNPYLASRFTGESDDLHRQWIVIDLGKKTPIGALRITWADPYARSFEVQRWTGDDAIYDQAHGAWDTFPEGSFTAGRGGVFTRQIAPAALPVRYVRVLMSDSSGTCDSHGSADPRDCVGYAIAEVGLGTMSGGAFSDVMHTGKHASTQTVTYASSVDPWHQASDGVTHQEQPGLDRVFQSGVTRGLPMMVPVGMLYGTPTDAAAEVAYLEARGYPFTQVELGEEPDGQYITPEDYGALYVQWAAAIHAVDASLRLGGPSFQEGVQQVRVWPDASGQTSWFARFLSYLSGRGRLGDLSFASFEHYPWGCAADWSRLLDEPGALAAIFKGAAEEGLPSSVPLLTTEYNFSFRDSPAFQEVLGAVWQADMLGAFFTAGGKAAYYYELEPTPPWVSADECSSTSSYGMFLANDRYQVVQRTSQFYSTQLVSTELLEPVDELQDVYPATSRVLAPTGQALVTAYAARRPDGQVAVMLINKDPLDAEPVTVGFPACGAAERHFASPVTEIHLGMADYTWDPDAGGATLLHAPVERPLPAGAGATFTLPAGSITVLRGPLE